VGGSAAKLKTDGGLDGGKGSRERRGARSGDSEKKRDSYHHTGCITKWMDGAVSITGEEMRETASKRSPFDFLGRQS